MTIADMVAKLVSAGCDIGVAQEVLSSFDGLRTADEKRRLDQRDRKRRSRDRSRDGHVTVTGQTDNPQDVVPKQTMGPNQLCGEPEAAPARSRDRAVGAVVLLTSSSLTSSEGPEERKKELEVNVSARARRNDHAKRGSRFPAGWTPTGEYFSAATELGLEADQIAAVGAEFHDYWVGVPGQRGCKLDWLATWRNRCREVVARNKRFNGGQRGKRPDGSHRSNGDAFLDGLASVAKDIRGNRQMAKPADPDLPFGQPITQRR